MTITYPSYAEMLNDLRDLAATAAGVEGADAIGAFFPLAKAGQSRAYGEFSSLSEFLDDFADAIQDFLASGEGSETESWDAS